METCLGFNIDCGILAKGVGVVLMASPCSWAASTCS